jgi:hypothetical protein
MAPIDSLSWQQFSSLPNISKLPLSEQMRQYNIYTEQILQESILIQQMLSPEIPSVLGGGSLIQQIVENSGCIEFVADATDDNYFEMNVGVSSPTTYTVDWGDGTTDEGSLTDGSTSIEHNFPDSEEQYTVRMCFADPSLVTSLEFTGND